MLFAGTVNDKCTSLIKGWPTLLVLLSFRMNMRCEVSGVSVAFHELQYFTDCHVFV